MTTSFKNKRRALRNPHANPVAQAIQRSQAMAIIERIRTDANIHALISQYPQAAINAAGRIMFIALGACLSMGSSGDELDLRIIRGVASAAGDVAANPALLDANHQAIISDLDATARIWPALHPRNLIDQYIKLEQKLTSPHGLSLSDFETQNSTSPA